jgi:hypothetical protein
LFKDFYQLAPVMDTALYWQLNERSPRIIQRAFQLYRAGFTKVFELTRQMHQQGQTENDLKFAIVLTHTRTGVIVQDNWQFFREEF